LIVMGFIALVLVKKSEPLFMFEFVIPVKTGIQVKALWIPAGVYPVLVD